jgi:hypothetical protein
MSAGCSAGDAVPDAVDTPELLNIDVEQLARAFTLIAVDGLERLQPAALAKPDPQQHRRDGRELHREQL